MRTPLLMIFLCPFAAFAAVPKACIPIEETANLSTKDVCVAAHVYDVVELPDGTRLLDVCGPDKRGEQCRFTVVSLSEDRDQVGDLRRYRDTDVRIRGIVRPMRGRNSMLLSHARQFRGGPPKFRPNPKLLHGFTGEQSQPPVADPNLRARAGNR